MDCEANARLRMRLFGTTVTAVELRKFAKDLLSDETFLRTMEAAFLVREKDQTLDIMPSKAVRATVRPMRFEGAGESQLRMWPGHALPRSESRLFDPRAALQQL